MAELPSEAQQESITEYEIEPVEITASRPMQSPSISNAPSRQSQLEANQAARYRRLQNWRPPVHPGAGIFVGGGGDMGFGIGRGLADAVVNAPLVIIPEVAVLRWNRM